MSDDGRRGPRMKPVDPAEFKAPTAKRVGRRRALTPAQVLELAAWVRARRTLGNNKTKAAEFGVSAETISHYVQRIRRGDARGRGE